MDVFPYIRFAGGNAATPVSREQELDSVEGVLIHNRLMVMLHGDPVALVAPLIPFAVRVDIVGIRRGRHG